MLNRKNQIRFYKKGEINMVAKIVIGVIIAIVVIAAIVIYKKNH